jgi:hypothetical protein
MVLDHEPQERAIRYPARLGTTLYPNLHLVTLDGIASHRERIPRVENSIPDKFKQIAMKFIRTGFVTRLTEPADLPPVAAAVALVSTLNSCSASGKGVDMYPFPWGSCERLHPK